MPENPWDNNDDKPKESCPCKPFATWFREGDEWVCLECGAVYEVKDDEDNT